LRASDTLYVISSDSFNTMNKVHHCPLQLSPLALVVLLAWPTALHAQAQPSDEPQLQPVQVNAVRLDLRVAETPASVDVRSAQDIQRAGPQVNISESLSGVPGLVANNRNNYAQDVQLSSRGFGARTAFGVRGIRIFVDGIPGNSPDGQGQVSHVDLSSARQVEVLRGPFSALYGNASGGVILVDTETGGKDTLWTSQLAAGSSDSYRLGQKISGSAGLMNYVVSASHFSTEGWRDRSEARKNQFNAKLGFRISADTQATFVANAVRMPDAQDPQGVTRAGLATPRAVPASVIAFDTRKSTSQNQLGINLDHRFNPEHALKLVAWHGSRDITQFLSTPIGAQTPPSSAGGVIDLDRSYHGADVRYTFTRKLANGPFVLHLGASQERLSEERRGFENFVGTTTGVQGRLRRDENNRLGSDNLYAQAQWWVLESTALHAGWRSNRIRLRSQDRFIATGNPDDSGTITYRGNTPVLGVLHNLSETLNVYASWARGFDAPTMNEVAYNPNPALSGLNLGLKPAKSRQWELGLKWAWQRGSNLNLALFDARTSNEIVVLSNNSGRSRFQNAGRSTRQGIEAALEHAITPAWQLRASLSYLNARYTDAFTSCYLTTCSATGTGANAPRLVPAGSRIPGTSRLNAFAELMWRPKGGGVEASLEWRGVGKVAVDDLNSEYAPGYGLLAARVAFKQQIGRWQLSQSIRVENLANRSYVGSVIVNQANSQFYEPGQARNWWAGLTAQYRF
jgi:iron complex outermembrane recepter protein